MTGPSPGGGPQKRVNKANKDLFPNVSEKNRGLKLRFLAFPGGPGGFRELREAGRNHFHLSWYVLVPGVTSYGQKTNKDKTHIKKKQFFIGYAFSKTTWSGLNFGLLGPENLDSSSKTTYIVLFPGLNSYIQVEIPCFV